LKNHDLITDIHSAPLYVNGDSVRLSQVVTNLLSNAARYMDRGGRIILKLDREGSNAVVRVRDYGIGISPDQMSRIFDMFTQVDHSLDHGQGGLGVGLSLSKQLVNLHGGTIEANSEGLGKGSEFIVRIPIASEPPPEAAKSSSPDRTPIHRHRILVADDNQDSAIVLAHFLATEGHEVQTVYNGVRAIEAVKLLRPEVAILDIGMPGLNGYETAQQIRSEFGSTIVLIAVTGWGQEEDKKRSREAGFDYHLTKPIDVLTLEQILAQLH